jgi:hypothetical protein
MLGNKKPRTDEQQRQSDDIDTLPTMQDEDCGVPQYPIDEEFEPKQQR